MSKEAMKLALEALTHGCPPDCKGGMTDSGGIHPWGEAVLVPCPNCKAITTLREALAEQPAQQEPVATDWERIARVQNAKLMAVCDEPEGFEKLCEVMDRYERTSPPAQQESVANYCKECLTYNGHHEGCSHHTSLPAQRTWVGLTDEEIKQAMDYWSSDEHSAYGGAASAAGEYFDVETSWRYIEAKLKEKNGL